MAQDKGKGSGRGRPRVYLDDAERAQAHRERVADSLAKLHMLEVIFDRPTPDLIRSLSAKFARQCEDKSVGAARLIEALLSGLADGGGANVSESAANFVRYEFSAPSPLRKKVVSEAARSEALLRIEARRTSSNPRSEV